MANSEADFKTEFCSALKYQYGDKAHIWKITDKFKVGTADISAIYGSYGFSIEAKFVKELPDSKEAKVLKHPVTSAQHLFLKRSFLAGGYSAVLVGFRLGQYMNTIIETATAVPFWLYDQHKDNFSREAFEKVPRELYFTKDPRKGWQVERFFEKVMRYGQQ